MTSLRAPFQPSLLGQGKTLEVDRGFRSVTRRDLDGKAWVDYAPGWLGGADELFSELVDAAAWANHQRRMYDKIGPRISITFRHSF